MLRRDQQPVPVPTPAQKPPRQEPPPRLVSFGRRKVTIQGHHGRPDQEIEYESAFDVAHPTNIYYRQVDSDQPWQPKDVDNRPNTTILESGIWIRRNDPNREVTGKANVVTTFPPLSEAERAAAAVLRGIVSEH